MSMHITTIIDDQSFSDGSNLTEWMVRRGAPELPHGFRYRLVVNDRSNRGPLVTAQIFEGGMLHSEYTEVTRVSVNMAAIAAAKYAYEDISERLAR